MSAVSERPIGPVIYSVDELTCQELKRRLELKQLSKKIHAEFMGFCRTKPVNEEATLEELRQYVQKASAIKQGQYLEGLEKLLDLSIQHHQNRLVQEVFRAITNVQPFELDSPKVSNFSIHANPHYQYGSSNYAYNKSTECIQSLFLHAMKSQNAEAMRFFLENGANSNRLYSGYTREQIGEGCYIYPEKYYSPVHYAVSLENQEFLSILLDHGGNPNLKLEDSSRTTNPVDLAEKLKKTEIIELLKSKGGCATPPTRLSDMLSLAYWFPQTASTSGTSELLPVQVKQLDV